MLPNISIGSTLFLVPSVKYICPHADIQPLATLVKRNAKQTFKRNTDYELKQEKERLFEKNRRKFDVFLQNQSHVANTITGIIAQKGKILGFNQTYFMCLLLYECLFHHKNKVLEVGFNVKLIKYANQLSVINLFVSFSSVYFIKLLTFLHFTCFRANEYLPTITLI